MTARPDDVDPARLLALTRRISTIVELSALAIHAALVATMWSSGLGPWLIAFAVVIGPANVVISALGPRAVGFDGADWLRVAVNLVGHGAIGVLCGWPLPVWLFLPLITALVGYPPASPGHLRAAVIIAGFPALALTTGGHGHDAAVFAGVALFLHLMLVTHTDIRDGLQAERDRSAATLHDARERALVQDKLASIGQVAAGVAHEINNPMCFVTANVRDLLDELQRAPTLPPALAEYRDTIVPETLDGIARVNAIAADLRRFARGEPVVRVRFALAGELEAAVRLCRPQVGSDQRLELAAEPGLWLEGAPQPLVQAVVNLVVNGLQALDGPGVVRVLARAEDGQVVVEVVDTGCGMSAEVQARVFEPFFTTKPAGIGVGLGMAVVQGVVAGHGGRIDVDSAPGRGTAIRLTLPRVAPPDVAGPAPRPAAPDALPAPLLDRHRQGRDDAVAEALELG